MVFDDRPRAGFLPRGRRRGRRRGGRRDDCRGAVLVAVRRVVAVLLMAAAVRGLGGACRSPQDLVVVTLRHGLRRELPVSRLFCTLRSRSRGIRYVLVEGVGCRLPLLGPVLSNVAVQESEVRRLEDGPRLSIGESAGSGCPGCCRRLAHGCVCSPAHAGAQKSANGTSNISVFDQP